MPQESGDWNNLIKPQTPDNELQAALRNYLRRGLTPITTTTTTASVPEWKDISHPSWAGTPTYVSSSTQPISVEKMARRYRPRARPVPAAATCMSVSRGGDFIAVAYSLSKMVVNIVGPANKRHTQEQPQNAWKLLLVAVFDIRAHNIPVRWLVGGDVDDTTGEPCEFELNQMPMIKHLSWSSDGSVLYGGTNTGTLYGWNVVAGKLDTFHRFLDDDRLQWKDTPQWVSIQDIATHPKDSTKTLISVPSRAAKQHSIMAKQETQ